jgi:bifunctional DNA-binding transcriptional regulator/antitoxin component of YhaV-PrlF toxin-antitoxin module
MVTAESKVIAIVRLSEKGQLTIPADYRRAHALGRDSTLVLVEMGEALVVVPHDEALAEVGARLEAAMFGAGATVEDLVSAAEEARARIVGEEFGEEGEQD